MPRKNLKVINVKSSPFCLSDAIVGIGGLSDHCLDITHHGRKFKDVVPHCNTGYSNLIWRFRNHIMNNMNFSNNNNNYYYYYNNRDTGDVKQLRPRHLISVFGRKDGKRMPRGIYDMVQQLGEKYDVTVQYFSELHDQSFDSQVDLVRESTVLVTPSGGASFIGLFLPRGASMLLFADEEKEGFLDFGFYSSLSHIEVSYLPLKSRINFLEVDPILLEKSIARALDSFDNFHDSLFS